MHCHRLLTAIASAKGSCLGFAVVGKGEPGKVVDGLFGQGTGQIHPQATVLFVLKVRGIDVPHCFAEGGFTIDEERNGLRHCVLPHQPKCAALPRAGGTPCGLPPFQALGQGASVSILGGRQNQCTDFGKAAARGRRPLGNYGGKWVTHGPSTPQPCWHKLSAGQEWPELFRCGLHDKAFVDFV